jgi:hypothetical protein
MNAERRTPALRWAACPLGLAACCGLLTGLAAAQEPTKPAPVDAGATDTAVFSLQYARAADLARTLEELLDGKPGDSSVRMAVDERANSLIVAGSAADVARVKALVVKLDTPRAENDGARRRLKIFELRSIEPDKSLEAVLRLAMRSSANGDFALDRERKLVIVSADEDTSGAVEALLERLDRQAAEPTGQDVQVRVVWLVKGLGRDDAAPAPDDLKDVLPSLAKLGIDQPRLAAQTLINVTPNAQFQAKGVAKLDSPCQFSVTGRFSDKRDAPSLEISLRAERAREHGSEEVCNLQTEISAPPGHLVLLGVTPTESATSVFVVQVLRKDGDKPKPPR